MSLSDERVDQLIDDVARAMTAGGHRELALGLGDRLIERRRHRPRLLVPAIAAAAIVLAAIAVTLMRSSNQSPVTSRQSPVASGQSSVTSHQQPATSNQRPAAYHQRTVPGRAPRFTARPQPLPPAFVTDLSPAPLVVAPVGVPAIEPPPSLELPALVVEPIPIPPVEDKGGSR